MATAHANRRHDGKRRPWVRWWALGLAASVLGLAAACGGGDTPTPASRSDAGADLDGGPAEGERSGVSMVADDAEARSGDSAGGGDVGASRVTVQGQLFIRTGKVTLVSDDLNEARDAVDRLVGRYGGHVAEEQTDNDRDGRTQTATLTLRVPSAEFRTVMKAFEDLGTVQSSATGEEDVTTEVIDVASRIRTQEVSLRRLRGFLDRSRNVNAMIRLESEIARREAGLASLRAQQDYLDDQTSLSTIDLTLRQSDEDPGPDPEDPLAGAGFFAGLSNGWNALLDVLVVVATVLGAAIPFLVLLAVLGVPAALWFRVRAASARARSRSAA